MAPTSLPMTRKSANTKANSPPIRMAEERDTAYQMTERNERGDGDREAAKQTEEKVNLNKERRQRAEDCDLLRELQ